MGYEYQLGVAKKECEAELRFPGWYMSIAERDGFVLYVAQSRDVGACQGGPSAVVLAVSDEEESYCDGDLGYFQKHSPFDLKFEFTGGYAVESSAIEQLREATEFDDICNRLAVLGKIECSGEDEGCFYQQFKVKYCEDRDESVSKFCTIMSELKEAFESLELKYLLKFPDPHQQPWSTPDYDFELDYDGPWLGPYTIAKASLAATQAGGDDLEVYVRASGILVDGREFPSSFEALEEKYLNTRERIIGAIRGGYVTIGIKDSLDGRMVLPKRLRSDPEFVAEAVSVDDSSFQWIGSE